LDDRFAVPFLITNLQRINQPRARIGPHDQAVYEHEGVVEAGVGVAVGRGQLDDAPVSVEAREAALHQAHQVRLDARLLTDGVRRARVARRVLLADRDGRADADDFVHIGFIHAFEELPRVSRQRFDVTALTFGIDGVEGQRGFARTAHAGNDGELVDGNLDVD